MIYRLCSITVFICLILTIYYLVLNYLDEGPIGSKGQKGNKGSTGNKGIIGQKGLEGERGPIGNKGEINLSATQGPQGDMGERGDVGPRGERGERGEDGEKGFKGKPGDPGLKGDNGVQGPKGVKGKDGNDNKLKFQLIGSTDYEGKVDIETLGSTAFNDYLRPNPGTTPGEGENGSFIKFAKGLPLKSVNNNMNWNNFVTGFILKGDSITEDRAKAYYTNIKVLI